MPVIFIILACILYALYFIISSIYPAIIFAIFVLLAYLMYVAIYFKGKKFNEIKNSINVHINDCNNLNRHIEELKSSYSDINQVDHGNGHLYDNSNYHMDRRRWKEELKNSRTYNCSAIVCKNANNQPFKYLCKYFNIKANTENLSKFESVLNNFSAAEQGKILLVKERDEIVSGIKDKIPQIIFHFNRQRIIKELGFNHVDLTELYFPIYTFQYVSAGGNSSLKCDIKLDTQNLDRFIIYLGDLLKFRNSVLGQRSLMTSTLREKIKTRDNFSCKICAISTRDEKNLLLEIDHIIPLSKGGITSEENLQTLCWRCNRSKGSKVLSPLYELRSPGVPVGVSEITLRLP